MKKQTAFLLLAVLAATPWVDAGGIPVKFTDRSLTRPAGAVRRFSAELLANHEFVNQKREERRACRRSASDGFLAPAAGNQGDQLGVFLDSPRYLRSLEQMESRGLLEARVARQPWSADYWPIARGVLGARNFELAFNIQADWKKRSLYIQRYPTAEVLRVRGEEGLAKLAPSEKYDLIIGDEQGQMTASMWDQGREYFDRTGEVENWMGICHGWAPAAISDPRPAAAVAVPSLDGKWQVPLAPAEIKGLVSFSWATNRYSSLMLGGRCNKKDPQRDANGRLIDPECFDLNPATWHIAIVNKVGLKKESFVMDATYDYEVWNQPVLGYSYTYFNPETGIAGGRAASTIAARAYVDDPYRSYRGGDVASIVGVRMRVGYVVETSVNPDPSDDEGRDIIRWVEYDYDLELDAQDRIIGGEWHLDAHPDFIWIPRTGFRPQSPLDSAIAGEGWDNGSAIPAKWAKAAQYGAARGIILDTLTDALLKKSARAIPPALLK